jgi:hypothetical protein
LRKKLSITSLFNETIRPILSLGVGRESEAHPAINLMPSLQAIAKPVFSVTLSVSEGSRYLKILDSSLRSE